jgi:hypothetical protein
MTASDIASAPAADRPVPAVLRPVGVGFLAAAALWVIGDVIELSFAKTDTIADGASFVVGEIVFYAAMIVFAVSALTGARRGLAGGSTTGRIGLVAIAVAYLLVMVAGVLFNVLGMEAAVIGLAVGGFAQVLAALVAGIGILLRGPVPRPGRAVFLVYGIAYTLMFVLAGAVGDTAKGPGYVVEFAQAAFWALIGLSILKPVPRGWNIGWFAAAIVLGVVAIAGILLAQ